MTPDQLFDAIVAAAPAFASDREEHIATYDELLSHVLMGDLRRFVVESLENDRVDVVRRILEVLDRGMEHGDASTISAIQVSFVEDVRQEPLFCELEPLLGPQLRAELVRQEQWPSA